MEQGRVKWFSQMKGFGFLELNGKDVYVHYTALQGRSDNGLQEGQQVSFDLIDTGKGLEAMNVSVLGL